MWSLTTENRCCHSSTSTEGKFVLEVEPKQARMAPGGQRACLRVHAFTAELHIRGEGHVASGFGLLQRPEDTLLVGGVDPMLCTIKPHRAVTTVLPYQ